MCFVKFHLPLGCVSRGVILSVAKNLVNRKIVSASLSLPFALSEVEGVSRTGTYPNGNGMVR